MVLVKVLYQGPLCCELRSVKPKIHDLAQKFLYIFVMDIDLSSAPQTGLVAHG